MSPEGMTLLQWSSEARRNVAVTRARLASTMRESRRICDAILCPRPRCKSTVRSKSTTPNPKIVQHYAIVGIRADGTRDVLLDDLPFRVAAGLKETLIGSSAAARILLAMQVSPHATDPDRQPESN